MPRRYKESKVGGRVVRVEFHSYLSSAMSSGVAVIALSPANIGSASITNILAGFEQYRFTRLSVHLVPRGASNALACAYTPDPVQGSPASFADVMAQLDATLIIAPSGHTVNQSFTVDPFRLKGQLEWYKCTADASDTSFENQGSLMWFGTTTEAINTILRGTIEFRNPVDSTVAVQRMRDQIRAEVFDEIKASARSSTVASPSNVGKRQLPP